MRTQSVDDGAVLLSELLAGRGAGPWLCGLCEAVEVSLAGVTAGEAFLGRLVEGAPVEPLCPLCAYRWAVAGALVWCWPHVGPAAAGEVS